MRVLIIIPALNEELSIGGVIDDLRTHYAEADILVVDDGSADRTADIAKGKGATVISLPFNLGIGAAMQTGYRFALQKGYDAALQFDGDGQHRADQIGVLMEPLLDGEADLVIGSRFARKGIYDAETSRFLGIKILSWVISVLISQKVTDPTSGFRVANSRVIASYAGNYPDDYPEPEAIVLLHRQGFRIREVPVVMEKRSLGNSSITLVRGIYYMVKVLLAIFVDMIKKV